MSGIDDLQRIHYIRVSIIEGNREQKKPDKGVFGIRSWEPGSYDPDKDWQRMLWHWLQQGAAGDQELPLLYLGYGTEDPYLTGQTLLATILPVDRVFAIPGNHTAKTMREAWILFLDQGVMNTNR